MENEYYGFIYKITNLINNKVYVGQTKNIKDRWREHKKNARNKIIKGNMAITKAMIKYGLDNFTFEVIDQAYSVDELNQLEEHYINNLNSLSPQGYNIQEYSNGVPIWSDERKLEATKKNLNRKKPNAISKYFGVTYNKRDNNWVASVIFQRKDFRIGKYDTEIEAAQARDIEVLKDKYLGLFELNFPELRDNYLNNEIVVLRSMDKRLCKSDNLPDIFPSESGDCWFVLIMSNEGIKYFDSFETEQEAVQVHKNKLIEFNLKQ